MNCNNYLNNQCDKLRGSAPESEGFLEALSKEERLNSLILEEYLNSSTKEERLAALNELMALYHSGKIESPPQGGNVNNHIHTIYSFSPYSPTKAAYLAWKNGLATAGIMDHDSVGGLKEFIEAGQMIGIAITCGFELRCSFSDTPFNGRRINNPDQDSVAYLAMHGIPHHKIDEAEAFLMPYREARNRRNRLMTEKLNLSIQPSGLSIDYETDVVPLSQSKEGGSITERHILFALARKIMEKVTPGPDLVMFLRKHFDIDASDGVLDKKVISHYDKSSLDSESVTTDSQHQTLITTSMYRYHLLGLLKGYFVEAFYVDATEELPSYKDFIKLAKSLGAIPAYAYLGDVGTSVTGDKRTQSFEDAFLDELVPFLKEAGFEAITYMPTRNTHQQLQRLMNLCEKYQLFQICGEDINSPFQSFVCEALEKEEYKHLTTAAWALIGHENSEEGMFRKGTPWESWLIDKKVEHFAKLGIKGRSLSIT
jgi:hypothetical protein